MTRTDVHSPKNLITEDYEFVGCIDAGNGWEPEYVDDEVRRAEEDGWEFGENHSAGSCYHCGARVRYMAVLKHQPSHSLVTVGETCLQNRFSLATVAFHALRKAAELQRAEHRIVWARTEWFAVDSDRAVAYTWASDRVVAGDYGFEGMRHSFVHKVNRYGTTSDKFVKAIMRDMARTERREAEKAAEKAAEITSPVIEGKIQVTGEVLTIKFQESDFGGSLKMLVRDDRGFKVWGTVPSSLHLTRSYDEATGEWTELDGATKGSRVTFTATVERSRDDETFGFFKRPTKASVVEEPAAVAA